MAKWIAGAIKRPGSLREAAARRGLIKGEEKMTQRDLFSMGKSAKKSGDTTMMRRVNLAKTLAKLRHGK